MNEPAPILQTAPALPGRAFVRQGWRDVVFLHWWVDVSAVERLLPAGTRPDTFDPTGADTGMTWVGLIGFVFEDTRFPPLAPMHRLGTFVEMNVRVYTIDRAGRRGVTFLSLDAGRLLPAAAARAMLGLPYHWANAQVRRTADTVQYAMRRHRSSLHSRMDVRIGGPIEAPTELDRFLTARWGMHVRRFGVTRFWPNEHVAWPLHHATATLVRDDLLGAAGLPRSLADVPPDSVLFSPGVETGFARGTR